MNKVLKGEFSIPISKPEIGIKEKGAVMAVLNSGYIVEGVTVKKLENRITDYIGSKYAIAVNSGTAALHSALYALGVGKGDEVITTPFTFIATANAILMVGATPVFADIRKDMFTIDPREIEKKITKKTKAIIAVDLYGQPADYEEILSIAKKYGLFVIDDAAQSIGAMYKNKAIGTIADVTCFSFYATKNIMCGEGGMITTNNSDVADRIRRFKNHGQRIGVRYAYTGFGFNYRMTNIVAAIANEQLKSIEKIIKARSAIASLYDQALSGIRGIVIPKRGEGRTHVFHQYTVRITEEFSCSRDVVREKLKERKIQTEVYYPAPLYVYPHLAGGLSKISGFKETESAVKQVLSLPIYPQLQSKEIQYIIDSILSL